MINIIIIILTEIVFGARVVFRTRRIRQEHARGYANDRNSRHVFGLISCAVASLTKQITCGAYGCEKY